MKPLPPANFYTLGLGLFLLAEGIWGLFSEIVFGVLATNTPHAIIHLALGVAALLLYRSPAGARSYALGVGSLLLVVGLLRFVPGIDAVIVDLLNVNTPTAALNILLGGIGLAVGYGMSSLEPPIRRTVRNDPYANRS